MPFELQNVTEVKFTNSNPRSEFHGEEHVRAIDIAMTIEGENTLLDLIEKGLREREYCNRALQAGQEGLPDVVIPLPNLRFPKLPARTTYGTKKDRARGYRFIIDYGLGEDAGSNVDFTDCVVGGIWYEVFEGGSVKVGFTVQYNGDELTDDALYGRLAGLGTLAEGHVQLIAPPTLVLVKGKGWRSGKADTPADKVKGDDGTGDLLASGDGFEVRDPNAGDEDEDTPEKALVRGAAGG
jgi:hypothetical protein